MITIKSIDELPAPLPPSETRARTAPWEFRFLRSASDLAVLIDCATGDCYRSPDGSAWLHEGYSVERDSASSKVTREPKTAFAGGDTAKGTAKNYRGARNAA